MAQTQQHRWSTEGFLRAWEAGAFDDARVEMVEGEVWPVSIGTWHGDTTVEVTLALPRSGVKISTQSLVLSTSVVDPDLWVRTDKARTYAAAGFPVCWVVSREGVHEHTDPTPFGYRSVRRYWPGDRLPVPYADAVVDVGAVVGAPA